MLRKGVKNRAKVSVNEKLDIAYKAIVEKEKVADLAREYRVTNARIS